MKIQLCNVKKHLIAISKHNIFLNDCHSICHQINMSKKRNVNCVLSVAIVGYRRNPRIKIKPGNFCFIGSKEHNYDHILVFLDKEIFKTIGDNYSYEKHYMFEISYL